MTAVPWGSHSPLLRYQWNEAVQAIAAVTQAQVRLDATERVVASVQLEASLADDDAQRVHTGTGPPQKIFDGQRVLFEAGATPRLTYESASRELENAAVHGCGLSGSGDGPSPSGCTQGTRECRENRGP